MIWLNYSPTADRGIAIEGETDFTSLVEEDQEDLSDYDLGFFRGVFAARGYTSPTEEQFREALQLLQLHHSTSDGEAN